MSIFTNISSFDLTLRGPSDQAGMGGYNMEWSQEFTIKAGATVDLPSFFERYAGGQLRLIKSTPDPIAGPEYGLVYLAGSLEYPTSIWTVDSPAGAVGDPDAGEVRSFPDGADTGAVIALPLLRGDEKRVGNLSKVSKRRDLLGTAEFLAAGACKVQAFVKASADGAYTFVPHLMLVKANGSSAENVASPPMSFQLEGGRWSNISVSFDASSMGARHGDMLMINFVRLGTTDLSAGTVVLKQVEVVQL